MKTLAYNVITLKLSFLRQASTRLWDHEHQKTYSFYYYFSQKYFESADVFLLFLHPFSIETFAHTVILSDKIITIIIHYVSMR